MRDATIATSRTRADRRPLIDYRPVPASWGDTEALHQLRLQKARAAELGEDPSLLQFRAVPAPQQRTRTPLARPRRRAPWRPTFQFVG